MGKQSKPITPQDAQSKFFDIIPDVIIDAVNELIVKGYNPNTMKSVVYERDIIDMVAGDDGNKRAEVYDHHWLDFEKIYRQNGWDVKYVYPEWDENFKPHFIFSAKKN